MFGPSSGSDHHRSRNHNHQKRADDDLDEEMSEVPQPFAYTEPSSPTPRAFAFEHDIPQHTPLGQVPAYPVRNMPVYSLGARGRYVEVINGQKQTLPPPAWKMEHGRREKKQGRRAKAQSEKFREQVLRDLENTRKQNEQQSRREAEKAAHREELEESSDELLKHMRQKAKNRQEPQWKGKGKKLGDK